MEKVTIIEAGKIDRQYIKDLWNYRELFFSLALRDILVKYKQTIIGVAWAILQPLLSMIVFTFIFSNIAKLPSEGAAPYPIMVYAAMLPWNFFAWAFSSSSNSLISNASLITKIYFPRIIVPTSAVIVSLIDTLVAGAIIALMMIFYQYSPPMRVLLLPVFIIITFIMSLGLGLFIASLNVKYRDFRYVVPFIIQFGMYISPVGFSSSIIPEQWRILYSFNPMVGIIDGFRWCLIPDTDLNFTSLIIAFTVSITLFLFGAWYFRKFERYFTDII